MRILEQTTDIITLQNPARDFWFGKLFLFFGCPTMMVLFAMVGGWFFLLSFLFAVTWWLAFQQIWTSDVVKNCSFNKALNRVTIEFHGLRTKMKVLQLQEIKRVEVRKRIGFGYGVVIETSRLWLVTKYAEAIPLSEEHNSCNSHASASLKTITGQVRKILSLSSR